MGADVPSDEYDAIANEFVCDGDGLVGIASIVGDQQFDSLPENSTFFINVCDCHLGALLDLFAPKNVPAGEGAGCGDQDLPPRRHYAYRGQNEENNQHAL
jgi:hypothetical protein